ncbi:Oxygen-dependent choline dehydrogenase, partial [Phytophthora rubi]
MLRHCFHRPRLSPPPSRWASSLHSATEFDFIIVGGGSAGCVLANRLSADSRNSVLLVETGPKDRGLLDSIRLTMPAMLTANFMDDRYNWNFVTEPQRNLNGRRLTWPRGRVLGGSSSINAMIYSRGHALDYEDWEASGAAGWGYADCLPYFKRAQTHALGADEYRGGDGPLHVTRRLQRDQPLYQAFLDAAVQAGYPFTEDVNGHQQEGVGWLDLTIHKGERCSASAAYLAESVLSRRNLTVLTDTFVNKLLFEGKRAVGVEVEPFKSSGGQVPTRLRAAKEVILSGGAVNSPQLLMLSEADHALPRDAALPPQDGVDGDPVAHIEGAGTSSHIEAGGFIRSAPGKRHPDLKWQFLPGASDEDRQLLRDGHAMMLHCTTLRATSRGFIKLRSANPRESPIIEPNYLDTENDRVDLRNGVRLTREVLQQQAFDEFRGDAVSPSDLVQSDAEIDAWVRQHAGTDYHPSSTNRMGLESDVNSVVDFKTKVHGLERLRVVDASIMPNNVSGNLNAPTIMLAEKAADIILGNQKAPPRPDVAVYEPENWETTQRRHERDIRIPTAQLSSGLAPIGQRQYQPLLSKLQRPELVRAQGFIGGQWVEAAGSKHFTVE